MILKKLVLILACGLVGACSTFKIHQQDQEDPSKGIPFYTQKEVLEQTTVITRSWVNAEISYGLLKDSELQKETMQKYILRLDVNEFDLFALKERLKTFKGELPPAKDCLLTNCIKEKIDDLKEEFSQSGLLISAINFLKESSIEQADTTKSASHENTAAQLIQQLISNQFERKTIVDYSKKYYFNTKVYPFSNTNTTFTLSDKGTLTTAVNNVDTTGLADVIPLNDFLTDILDLGEATTTPDPAPAEPEPPTQAQLTALYNKYTGAEKALVARRLPEYEHQLSLTTEIKSFKYTLKKQHEVEYCKTNKCKALELSDPSVSVTRTISDQAKKPGKDKDKDDKSYQFSGKLTPPKK